MRLDPFHFRLWARLARETVHVGYPRAEPYYTPPAAGNVWDDRVEFATDAELAIAERIGQAVARMRQRNPELEVVLREWYGAYPNAPEKSERVKRLKMATQRVHELRRRAEIWVDGQLDDFLASA